MVVVELNSNNNYKLTKTITNATYNENYTSQSHLLLRFCIANYYQLFNARILHTFHKCVHVFVIII